MRVIRVNTCIAEGDSVYAFNARSMAAQESAANSGFVVRTASLQAEKPAFHVVCTSTSTPHSRCAEKNTSTCARHNTTRRHRTPLDPPRHDNTGTTPAARHGTHLVVGPGATVDVVHISSSQLAHGVFHAGAG